MRILLVNKYLHPRGGAERAVLELGAALSRRGHEISWFGMEHAENRVSGAQVGLVPRRDYHAAGLRRYRDAAAMLYSFAARRSFRALLRSARPEVVHVHNIYHQLTPSILDAAREHRVPVVMTVHDYKLVCPRYDMLREGRPCDACLDEGPLACLRYRCGGSWVQSAWLTAEALLHRARGSYASVRCFLAPSRFLQEMLARGGVDRARLRHLPNFAAATLPGSVQPQPERYVYAGRLSPEKGLRTLVRAAASLRAGSLHLFGAGPMEAELRRAAAAAPDTRVVLRGHLESQELWREVQAASFVVLPSECFENSPFAVLESMALGRAVLGSRLGGIPELIVEGETGELVTPGDVDAWRRALQGGIADPGRMARLGAAARQRALRLHGLDVHVEALEGIYAEVSQ